MRTSRLAIEIAALLALKLALLIALWALFFSPAHRAHVDPSKMQVHLAP